MYTRSFLKESNGYTYNFLNDFTMIFLKKRECKVIIDNGMWLTAENDKVVDHQPKWIQCQG